ncbi:MAG: hypothetical protein V3S30_08410, partial [Thermoanaerobaculia bacterium]
MNLRRYPASRSSTYCENACVATKLEALYLQVLAPSRYESGDNLRLERESVPGDPGAEALFNFLPV